MNSGSNVTLSSSCSPSNILVTLQSLPPSPYRSDISRFSSREMAAASRSNSAQLLSPSLNGNGGRSAPRGGAPVRISLGHLAVFQSLTSQGSIYRPSTEPVHSAASVQVGDWVGNVAVLQLSV